MSEPALERLDASRLAEALRAGLFRVYARAEHLDKINVFPVPDGDTGTNLSMTLSAVQATLDRAGPADHAGRLLASVADAAIDGARGNSGAILAQFMLGLADRVGALAELRAADLAAAFAQGASYAREALAEPREGTLLTVMDDVAAELQRLAGSERAGDLRTLLARALPKARESLERTRGAIEALREADVVDAGAQGFLELLEGMARNLETGETVAARAPEHHPEEMPAPAALATAQRYCTECIVAGEAMELRRMRERLSALGSSLVVAGSRSKVRVHVHTNTPEEVFRIAGGFGAVSGQKAEDMLRQQSSVRHARERRVAVVTDSAADVPEEALERLDLHLVPVRVHFGARSFLDKVSLTPEEFYRELARSAEHPKTSQPPPGDFRRLYEFLASHYEAVVSVALTARVSGTCDAARSAAERVAGGRVTVIDSGNVSLGQGLVAMYAAECAQAGLAAPQVIEATRAAIARTRTFGLIGRLDWAVRGGRIRPSVKRLADWLNLVPIVTNTPDGRIAVGGALFGGRRLRERFARYVRRRLPTGARYRIAVGHADAPEEGARLLREIVEGLPDLESSHLMPLGTALGVHGGPGMLVVGVQDYRPPPAASMAGLPRAAG